MSAGIETGTDILTQLRMRLGARNIVETTHLTALPANVDEVSDAVRIAAGSGRTVWPVGAGIYLEAIAPLPPNGLVLSSSRLNRVVDYQPEDLVVTVEAGVTLDALQTVLRAKRQFLPLNPPDGDHATIGGIIASASTGSWRAAYGGVRDYVLEVLTVDARGRAIRGGARVVKNVAGYDMPKLYTGSRGTLAYITQVTLKVRPLPETIQRLLFHADSWEALHRQVDSLVLTDIRPTVVEVIREDLRDERARPSAVITLEGAAETVEWQASAVLDALRGPGSMVSRIPTAPALPVGGDIEATLRVKPTDTTAAVEWLTANSWRGSAAYYPAEGRISLRFPTRPDTPAHFQLLREWVEARNGRATLERIPAAWIGTVDPWGTPRGDADMARSIKAAFDPEGVFPSF